jgi:hypothetical protein
VARIRTEVVLDEVVIRQAQAVADRTGQSRDAVIEEALRRQWAGQSLDDVLRQVRSRDNLSAEEALALAYRERDAARAERRPAAPGQHGAP